MMLLINTATENISIGIFGREKIKDIMVWQSYRTQSRELLPRIDKLLKKHGLSLSSLLAVVVIIGPGSYTGLRVGIAIANSLAWSLDIPVLGIKNGSSVNHIGLLDVFHKARKTLRNFRNKNFQRITLPKYD